MKNDIKEQLEKLQYYGEFYANIDGDVDDFYYGNYGLSDVSPKITEEEFVDVMNQLNNSINKNNELER